MRFDLDRVLQLVAVAEGRAIPAPGLIAYTDNELLAAAGMCSSSAKKVAEPLPTEQHLAGAGESVGLGAYIEPGLERIRDFAALRIANPLSGLPSAESPAKDAVEALLMTLALEFFRRNPGFVQSVVPPEADSDEWIESMVEREVESATFEGFELDPAAVRNALTNTPSPVAARIAADGIAISSRFKAEPVFRPTGHGIFEQEL